MRKGTFDDNSVDVFPFVEPTIEEQQREAVMRLVMQQPDGIELAYVLGLIESEPKPKPVPTVGVRKDWCEKHGTERVPRSRGTTRTVCRMCARDYYYARRARMNQEGKANDV